jgi:hypothetical protein
MVKKSSTKKAPWTHPPKAGAHHTQLSATKKRSAKARAKRAGRKYPNLVDNMNAARRS